MLAGALNFPQVRREAVQPLFFRFFLQHFRVAENRVHRRSQLMAHVGQELGLCPAGCLGGVPRVPQLLFSLLTVRDVGKRDDRPLHFAAAEDRRR